MLDWSSRPTHEVPADPVTFNTAPPWLIQSISERPELVNWLFNNAAGMDAAKREWASLPKDKQAEKLCWALTEFRKLNNIPEPQNNTQAGPPVATTNDPRQLSIPIPGQHPGYPPMSAPQPAAPQPVYPQTQPQPGYPPQGSAVPQPSYPQPAAPPPVQAPAPLPPPPPVYGQPQQFQPQQQFQMPPAPMYQPQQPAQVPQPTPAYAPNPAAPPPPFLTGPQPAAVPTTPSVSSVKTEGEHELREIIQNLTKMYEYQTELLLLNAAIGTAILRRAGVDAPLAEILKAHRDELLQVK